METILSAVLQKLLEYFLPILAVALVGFLAAKIKYFLAESKAWNPKITSLLEEAAVFAVMAAEQAGAAKVIESKKEYAFDIAERWLELRGVHIDLDLIDAAIEAAVYEKFNAGKTSAIGFNLAEGKAS